MKQDTAKWAKCLVQWATLALLITALVFVLDKKEGYSSGNIPTGKQCQQQLSKGCWASWGKFNNICLANKGNPTLCSDYYNYIQDNCHGRTQEECKKGFADELKNLNQN